MNNPEIQRGGQDNVETQRAAGERLEALAKKHEIAGEQSPDKKAELVQDAQREAKELAEAASKETHDNSETSAGAAHRVAFATRKAAYVATMHRVHENMSTSAQAFSKFIHAPFVEKSSEVIGGTLARPNAILAGSTTALIVVLALYVMARTYGYRLSGFETIGAFALGWVIGIIYDYVRVMALGRRS